MTRTAGRKPKADEHVAERIACRPVQLAMPTEIPVPANQNDGALQEAAGRRQCHEANELLVRSNLPDPLPVLAGEQDLLRIYFADLIEDVLKTPS